MFLSNSNMSSKHIVKPPLDFSQLEDFVSKEKTRRIYEKHWIAFVKFANISEKKPPTENLLLSFLKNRREEGKLVGKSLQALLSALSTICSYFYKYKIDQVHTSKFFKHSILILVSSISNAVLNSPEKKSKNSQRYKVIRVITSYWSIKSFSHSFF